MNKSKKCTSKRAFFTTGVFFALTLLLIFSFSGNISAFAAELEMVSVSEVYTNASITHIAGTIGATENTSSINGDGAIGERLNRLLS